MYTRGDPAAGVRRLADRTGLARYERHQTSGSGHVGDAALIDLGRPENRSEIRGSGGRSSRARRCRISSICSASPPIVRTGPRPGAKGQAPGPFSREAQVVARNRPVDRPDQGSRPFLARPGRPRRGDQLLGAARPGRTGPPLARQRRRAARRISESRIILAGGHAPRGSG